MNGETKSRDSTISLETLQCARQDSAGPTGRRRGRPRKRWQDEVSEDGRIVGGEEWQEKVYDKEEWKKLLRMARNLRIVHMPKEYNSYHPKE
jgi:hypothetical protein